MACKFFSSPTLPLHSKSSPSILTCRAQINPGVLTSSTQSQPGGTGQYKISFQTLEACKLGISMYPDFAYNAVGGNGTGIGKRKEDSDANDGNAELSVSFDVESLYIPALTGATTRFLGLPLPPFLKIEIVPEVFEGAIDTTSGKVELEFRAKFWFSLGQLYRAPPLVVGTTLTSEESIGSIRKGKGERMNEQGTCRLVGVATVEPIDDLLMDTFLSLPTECFAQLDARISIDNSD